MIIPGMATCKTHRNYQYIASNKECPLCAPRRRMLLGRKIQEATLLAHHPVASSEYGNRALCKLSSEVLENLTVQQIAQVLDAMASFWSEGYGKGFDAGWDITKPGK